MKRRILKPVQILLVMALAFSLLAGCNKSGREEVPESGTSQIISEIAVTESGSQTESVEGTDAVEGTEAGTDDKNEAESSGESTAAVVIDGTYTSKEDVAAYIHEFKCLPSNYITKKEAKELGWDSEKGNLWDVAPGKSIGGDKFGNYEGNLPDEKGRTYFECDIGYEGGYRGAERIIYSNDGLIYYTEDHYNTFELLYGQK